MAVVIRLQGLPLVAGSADIRRFFSGLNILDGGVHVTGGEKGEAFIIFATDEDARQAMSYSGGFIKDSCIQIFLSSRAEMQSTIEINRKKVVCGGGGLGSRWTGPNNSGTSDVGNLSNIIQVIEKGLGKSSHDSRVPLENKFHSSGSRNTEINISEFNFNQPRKEAAKSDGLYLFIRGMPYSSTEDDVLKFFSGLQVEKILMLKTNGRNNGGGLVKFATLNDAMKGRQRDRNYMGPLFLKVCPSNEETWIKYGGRIDEKIDNTFHFQHNLNKGHCFSNTEHPKNEPSYLSSRKRTQSRTPPYRIVSQVNSRSPTGMITECSYSKSPSQRVMAHAFSEPLQRDTAHSGSRSPRRVMARNGSRSPPRRVMEPIHSHSPRSITGSAHSTSPRRVKTHSRSPPQNEDYYIILRNLPDAVEKRNLRGFLKEVPFVNNDITFLKSHDEARNKHAIIVLRSERAYESALTYHKRELLGQEVYIFPISKKKALELIGSSEVKRSPEGHHHVKDKNNQDCSINQDGSKTCVYARNFPFDVTNGEVQKFFAGFNIDDNDIYLLYDDNAVGLGEALVKFKTENQARKAEKLNNRSFLGTNILLTCISEEQIQEFGINISSASNEKMQGHHHTREREQMQEFGINIPSASNEKMQGHHHSHEREQMQEFGINIPSASNEKMQGHHHTREREQMQEFGINISSASNEKMQGHHHSRKRDENIYSVDSQGPSVPEGDYRSLSDDFICSSNRVPPQFKEFGDGIPGNFSDRKLVPDSNFVRGSDSITWIKLKNIPFRASLNEILDFFHGYKIIPVSLYVQHNESGMFSEAIIALINYKEAQAVINELNDKPIGQQKVRLTLV